MKRQVAIKISQLTLARGLRLQCDARCLGKGKEIFYSLSHTLTWLRPKCWVINLN